MKVIIIGRTSRLLPLVQGIHGVTDVLYSIDGESKEPGAYILDHVNPELMEKISEHAAANRVIYVHNVRSGISDDYDRAKEACKLKDIPFIVDRGDSNVIDEIDRILFPDRHTERVLPSIALISAHRGAGAHMIAKSIGENLLSKTNASIGIINMDPYDVSSNTEGFFQLYKEYEAGGLTTRRIREIAESKNGLHIISGNPKLDFARKYGMDRIEQILSLIQHSFDLTIVLISPYWDNTLTLVPIKMIGRKYLVATSNQQSMNEFYQYLPQIRYLYGIDLRGTSFIYNFEGNGIETKLAISTQLQSSSILSLPYVPSTHPAASKHIQQGISAFSDMLMGDYDMPNLQEKVRKRSLFGLIPVRG
ncbi:hypothetical protein SAMN04487897_10933 [Paenibacillus sp. yr247]|uniref:hypothetical protein n=1 Tax=Paenibacillus sp. yr247 TaxID=1761880 RepID=UPI0008800E1B|nr:hypothetical protein [Paenibacillus sp. yr247]SDO15620.1 hypothetical protein SAMN04487897_10933 [Paenibacillus sp. yr247]